MAIPDTHHKANIDLYMPTDASTYNRRIQEGLRRAPIERARAIKALWGWFRSVS